MILVRLLDEDVDAWRPVEATRVSETVFVIAQQSVFPDETWEFQPGELVEVGMIETDDGPMLAAIGRPPSME